jgi:hypothetical protein
MAVFAGKDDIFLEEKMTAFRRKDAGYLDDKQISEL